MHKIDTQQQQSVPIMKVESVESTVHQLQQGQTVQLNSFIYASRPQPPQPPIVTPPRLPTEPPPFPAGFESQTANLSHADMDLLRRAR
jgi:hypothetical protein